MSSVTLTFVLCIYAKCFCSIWSTESLQWTYVDAFPLFPASSFLITSVYFLQTMITLLLALSAGTRTYSLWSSRRAVLYLVVVSCGLIETDYGGSLKHSLGPFLIHEGDQNQTAHAQYRYKSNDIIMT